MERQNKRYDKLWNILAVIFHGYGQMILKILGQV